MNGEQYLVWQLAEITEKLRIVLCNKWRRQDTWKHHFKQFFINISYANTQDSPELFQQCVSTHGTHRNITERLLESFLHLEHPGTLQKYFRVIATLERA